MREEIMRLTAAKQSPSPGHDARGRGAGPRADVRSTLMSIGGHQSSKMGKDEWLTPPDILRSLGEFDLDPCAPVLRPWEMARTHFTMMDNGLAKEWNGRVFCNPPYGDQTAHWLARCAEHGNAVALVFARTETVFFFEQVWKRATALLFIRSRLHFHHVDGSRAKSNSGGPSVLIAYGEANAKQLSQCGIPGAFVRGPIAVQEATEDAQRRFGDRA